MYSLYTKTTISNMRTTTNFLKDSISLYLSLCACLIAFSAFANNNTADFNHRLNDNDPSGNVSISMVTVGEFPKYGVNIPFNITVENQGTSEIYDIIVRNTIPAGYTFDPSGTAWIVDATDPSVYTNTIAGPIDPSESELITINLVPIASPDSTDWINEVEITEFRDGPGGTICSDGDLSDNSDSVAVALFDLAVRKELITPIPYCYGQLVTFRTYVMNQGNTPATAIELIDFVPEGFEYDATINAANGWTNSTPPTTLLPGQLNSNEETFIDIQLTIEMEMFDSLAWNNYTTVNTVKDVNGLNRTGFDADSNLGSNDISENAVLPGSANDDVINGGGPNAGEDEDDHDPAGPMIFDLAVEKVQMTALPSFSYGEQVVFRNTVFNQGNQRIKNIEIVDYIPCGMEFNSADNPNWTYNTVSRIAHYTFPNVIVPSGNEFIDIKLNVIQCYDDLNLAWSNFTEIAGATDLSGMPFVDIDSVMDSIQMNDKGAIHGTDSDNQLDGGGPKADEDEDDHDVKRIEVVDLALRSRIFEPGPFNFGDTITFVNTLYNQGNIILEDIRLRDYTRSGYTFPADINPTWTLNPSNNPEGLIPIRLNPEDSVNYEIHLILTPATSVTDYYNFTEIYLVKDTTSGFTSNRFDDADSFVGSHFFAGSSEPLVVPGSSDDDNIFGDGFDGGDNDDNDVAAPIFYDLALSKNLVDPGPNLAFGSPLTYVITVTNEGTIEANGVRVTDYFPCGFALDLAANPGWSIDPVTGYAFFDIPTTITPGGSTDVSIILTLQECANADASSYRNTAEISIDDGDDRDSNPNDNPDDDIDEDDIDSAELPFYDLSLTKTLTNSTASNSIGDPVTFTIEVTNEGNQTVQNVKVVDYLPCGFDFDTADNMGWSLNATTGFLEYNNNATLAPGAKFSTDLTVTIQTCAVPADGDYRNGAEISQAQDLDGNPAPDTDSTPDEIQGNDEDDEDDYDFAEIEFTGVYNLSLTKSLTVPVTSFAFGQVISYDITVANEGNILASGIEVTDYIPCGLSYDPANNSIPWVIDPVTGYASYTIPNDIPAGTTATVTISLTLEACPQDVPRKYNNKAEISMDDGDDENSDPDNDPDNDPPGEDDNDDEPLPIYDLSLTKTISNSTATTSIGDPITFTIEVTNEGNQTVQNVKVVDYLPCGFEFMAAGNAGWSLNATTGLLEYYNSPSLAPGATFSADLTVTIQACAVPGTADYRNGAEISQAQDLDGDMIVDIDSTPDEIEGNDSGEDDYDFAELSIDIYDLSLTKTLTVPVSSFAFGQVISYDITVTNEGNVVASGIEVTDYISCGLSYEAANNSINWIIDPVTGYASYVIPTDIAVGSSATVSILLTLEPCPQDAPRKYNNKAEISMDDGDDENSDPDNDPDNDPPGEDDNDDEPLSIYDLSLTKEISTPGNYSVGDMITFDITLANEGSESVKNVKVVDYLPCGYSFVPNNGWTLNATSGLLENTYTNQINPGESVTLSLDVTIVSCAQGGANNYVNGAEISQMENLDNMPVSDIDSNGDEIQGNELPGEDDYDEARIDIYDLSLSKNRINTGASLSYGSTLDYNLTVTNEGSLPASGIEVTDYIPCGLVYEAANNANSWVIDPVTGYATYTYPQTILPGESAVVGISLTLEPCDPPSTQAYNNKAEISMDDGDDDDSDPDDDPDNDPDGEDDTDDSPLPVYDLALTKTVKGDPSSFSIGDVATFEIEVTNEGNRTAQNIDVIDYVPCGFSTANQVNAGWMAIAGSNNITYQIPSLDPGQSVIIEVSFVIVSCDTYADENYSNEAEISSFEDEDGNEGDDIDSTPDDIPGDPESEDDNDTSILMINGSLGGDVWKDLDFDGIHDTNEPSISGMTVNLYDCNGNFIQSTTTGQTGFYAFTGLDSGGYRVQFDLNSLDEACVFTEPNVGNDDTIDSDANMNGFSPCTQVSLGSENYTVDAGLIESLASIGDFVFHDFDGDGVQDPGDTGIEDVKVYLHDAGGLVIDSTTTNALGEYRFEDVSQGNYYMEFGAMDIMIPTIPDATNDAQDSDVTGANGTNTSDMFFLSAGEENDDMDAGFYECATICGYTWLDLVDENDLRDPTENGVNGMNVKLFRIQDGVTTEYDNVYTGLNPDTPSDDGYFNFCVPPGRYYLEFVLPPVGLVQVLSLTGTNEINSDVNNFYGVGTTSSFVLGNGGQKCDIGAGFTLMSEVGNSVWFDSNLNGRRDALEDPIAGVVVQAYDMDNVMVAETVTDENGIYNIDYLQKKEYYLKFSAANGMAFTQPLVGNDDMLDSDVDHSFGPNTTRAFFNKPGTVNENMDAGVVFGVLPVEWGTIAAKNEGDHNLISWNTLSEVNNEKFLIQRSQIGSSLFTTIGEVRPLEANSANQQSYNFQDKDLIWDEYYYRIVQVNLDGRKSYSEIVAVEILKEHFLVFPNPTDRELRISSPSFQSMDDVTVNVYDQLGQLVLKSQFELQGNKEISISVLELNTGVYNIDVSNNGSTMYTQRFIKR